MTQSGTPLRSKCVWGPGAFFFSPAFYFSKMFSFCSLPALLLASFSSPIASFVVLLFHTVSMCLFYLAADSLLAVRSLTSQLPRGGRDLYASFLKSPVPNSIVPPHPHPVHFSLARLGSALPRPTSHRRP